MKVKRTKHAQRVMNFYKFKFDFQPPYNVLIDGTFCQAALQNRVSIKEQIEGYLPGAVKFFSTKCVIKELETIGEPVSASLKIINQFKIAKCPHTPLRTASDCISHLARRSKKSDKTKYIVATQDYKFIEVLRTFGGVPILTMKQKAIFLENPSDQSIAYEKEIEDPDIRKARELKENILGKQEKKVFKPKKIKGKNPLSCLKSKKVGSIQKKSDEKKNRRKKKKKVASTSATTTTINTE